MPLHDGTESAERASAEDVERAPYAPEREVEEAAGMVRPVVRGMRDRVHRLPGGRVAWRVGIALLGLIVVVVGVILLPLPGPG